MSSSAVLGLHRDRDRQAQQIGEFEGFVIQSLNTLSIAVFGASVFLLSRSLYRNPQLSEHSLAYLGAMALATVVYMANRPVLNRWNQQEMNDLEFRQTLGGPVPRISRWAGRRIVLADKGSTMMCAIAMASLLHDISERPEFFAARVVGAIVVMGALTKLQADNRPSVDRLNQQQSNDERLSRMPNQRRLTFA